MRRAAINGGRVVTLIAIAAAVLASCGGDDSVAPSKDRGAGRRPTATSPAVSPACPNGGAPVLDVRYTSVPGTDPNLLNLDIYPPATGCPAPVVMWVHGGGFRIGGKRNQLTDKVGLLNDLGYTVVSVNYRLTDPAAAEPVRYPTHAEDVASAIAWVERNIARSGGDPDQIAVMGHSAGAQIVATVATDPHLLGAHGLAPADLACVAPLDTEGFDVEREGRLGNPIYLDAFGTAPAVWPEASPVRQVAVGRGIPPHLIVRRETAPRQRVLAEYSAALTAAGVPVTTVDATDLAHNEVDSRIGAPGDTVMTPAVIAFLADPCFTSL